PATVGRGRRRCAVPRTRRLGALRLSRQAAVLLAAFRARAGRGFRRAAAVSLRLRTHLRGRGRASAAALIPPARAHRYPGEIGVRYRAEVEIAGDGCERRERWVEVT